MTIPYHFRYRSPFVGKYKESYVNPKATIFTNCLFSNDFPHITDIWNIYILDPDSLILDNAERLITEKSVDQN